MVVKERSLVLLMISALLLAVVALAAVPNAPTQVCVNSVCTTVAATTSAKAVKWHPGHYMLSNETDRSASGEIANKRNEQSLVVSAGANVVGWAGNYTWDILEPTQGNYDFSHIDADIAALSGKRIIIQIQSYYDPSNHIPSYILGNSAYGASPTAGQYGWWYGGGTGGTSIIAAKWRAAVMNRWIALVQALGAHYDGNPLVEAIVDADDTDWSLQPGSDYSVAGLRTQLDALGVAGVAALPTTNFTINQSFVEEGSAQDSANLLQDCYARRVAFGGPDILGSSFMSSNPTYYWGQGAYMGIEGTTPGTDYRGKMAAIHDIQSPELTGGLGLYTSQDIFNWANGNIHVDHMLWNYLGGTGNGNWTGGSNSVLAMINANSVTHTACPAAYTSGCNTN